MSWKRETQLKFHEFMSWKSKNSQNFMRSCHGRVKTAEISRNGAMEK